MKRQFLAGGCVIVLSVLVGGAFGTDYTWDDDKAGDHYWSSPENWEPNGVPDFGDDVSIGGGFAAGEYPVIGSGFNANTSELKIVGSGAIPSLTLEAGASLTHLPYPDDGSSPILLLGSGWATGQGVLNNYGGDVVTRKLWVGYRDLGVLNMTGGTISVQGVEGDDSSGLLEVARGDVCPCPSDCNEYPGNGYVHLDGGVIECDALTLRMGYSNCPDGSFEHYEDANGFINITGGTLILDGVFEFSPWYANKVLGVSTLEQIRQFEQNGWITAYGVGSMEDKTIVSHERARIVADYGWRNDGKTTVTAMKHENNQAYDFYPAPYAENVSPVVVLSWKAGDYIAYGGEYMGSPDVKKGNGHHVFIGKLEDMLPYIGGWNPHYPIGTHYGHIVGANDANRLDVGLLMPGGLLEGYTEYVWTVIEVNDANAPAGEWWWRAPLHYFRTRNICPKCWDLGTVGIGVGEPLEMELSWWSGYYTADVNGYMVYFGTDFNEVNDANENDAEYMGTVSEPVWVATDLELGQSYYWRVDDVNEAGPPPYLWKGQTCSFTIGDYRVVDDFDYANFDDMNDFWKINAWYADYVLPCSADGGGAWINLAGGAMSYTYDNNDYYDQYGPLGLDYFSEVRYEFASPVDFTYGDAETTLRALALDHTGAAGNAADPNYDRMYVALESANGNMAIVSNLDVSAQKKPTSQFNIDLRDFSNADVNVQSVVYLYLGFGIQCNPKTGTPGGEGVVNFDNIRVYPPRCVGHPGGVPYYGQLGDLTGDCMVDIKDINLLSNQWLVADRLTGIPVAVADNDPCMLARWEFESNYENDQYGTAGSLANGEACGTGGVPPTVDIIYDAERDSNVVYFNQNVNEYIDCNAGWGDMNGKSFTLSVWEKQQDSCDWGYMVGKGESPYKLQYGMLAFLRNKIHFATHQFGYVPDPQHVLNNGTWYHIAATWDEDEYAARVYINGKLAVERIFTDEEKPDHLYLEGNTGPNEPHVTMGAKWDETDDPAFIPPKVPGTVKDYFNGYLDDVRIYNRRLSEEEIMWLAGKTAPNYYAILPPAAYADIYSPEPKGQKIINFKDMAKMAQEWLESALWPVIP